MRLSGPLRFVFAFEEDGTPRVFPSPRDAVREFEGIDVENGSVQFFDHSVTLLQPVFTKPNRTFKIFGLFSWVVSGDCELTPSPTSTKGSFALALRKTRALEPNVWFSIIQQLKSALAHRGVQVE